MVESNAEVAPDTPAMAGDPLSLTSSLAARHEQIEEWRAVKPQCALAP
jgi:hypothetical protein